MSHGLAPRQRKNSSRRAILALVGVAVLVLIMTQGWNAIVRLKESPERMTISNNLKQLTLALHDAPFLEISQTVMSFGEDEDGEVYWMTKSPKDTGLYRPVKK